MRNKGLGTPITLGRPTKESNLSYCLPPPPGRIRPWSCNRAPSVSPLILRLSPRCVMVAIAALTPASPATAEGIRDQQWHLDSLDVAEAHRYSQGEGVIVAVVDCGVSPHPDLRRNLLRGTDIIHGGDGKGQRDQSGHGTAMAGVIAANGRRPWHRPESKILPVYVPIPKDGQGDPDRTGAGVEWAIAQGADVINLSQWWLLSSKA